MAELNPTIDVVLKEYWPRDIPNEGDLLSIAVAGKKSFYAVRFSETDVWLENLDIKDGRSMRLKLWIIWQVLRGTIVGMSNAPDRPLEVLIEANGR